MSLSEITLKNEFLKILDINNLEFTGFPSDINQMASVWANAYDIYAINAFDISGDTLKSSNKFGFETALKNSFILPNGSITAAAFAFEQAFVAYWLGTTFEIEKLPTTGIGGNGIFGLELSSLVVSVTPNILTNLLLSEFSILSNDPIAKAESLANIFHGATTTAVIVLISGLDTTPPISGGPLPITNINNIN